MIKIEEIEVFNFKAAFRGLRNAKDSWHLSDSYCDENNNFILGQKDLELAQRMLNAGTDESKFMRHIVASFDLTAPLRIWKEYDTYRVGVEKNSCSTMHTLEKKEITKDKFAFDGFDLNLPVLGTDDSTDLGWLIEDIVFYCEELRKRYNETKNPDYYRALISILPDAWMQKRTVTITYQALRAQYFARRFHKQQEWRDYCEILTTLPYGKELIAYRKDK
jgi:hypothetical protein